jgi:3-dehydroquinate synthase
MPEVEVRLGARSYRIHVGEGTLGKLGQALQGLAQQVVLLSNPTVLALYGQEVLRSLQEAGLSCQVVLVPDGEQYKTLLWAEFVHGQMLQGRADRATVLIALGGGVVGDLGGFVASTYMRGIRYVQVPTTLLAQVDSSVGGKTGVNHPLGKNMIGTFWQPALVWIDPLTLRSLPRRQLLAGLAECIKYGVIRDREFFDYLREHRDEVLALKGPALEHVIMRSCQLKAQVVEADEREAGLRAILNFGHTIGHAIETLTGYVEYLHGEAVAMGMCKEAELAASLGLLQRQELKALKDLVAAYGLQTELPRGLRAQQLLGAMEVDKKALGGQLRMVLPQEIGSVQLRPVKPQELLQVLPP